jgi:hypothetical protein
MTPSENLPPWVKLPPALLLALVAAGVVGAGLLVLASRPPGWRYRWALVRRDLDTLVTHPRLGLQRHAAWVDIGLIEQALDEHRRTTGRYPTDEEGLTPLIQTGALKEWPKDAWGRPYRYRLVGESPLVWTYGADGKEGGSGSDGDVYGRKPRI